MDIGLARRPPPDGDPPRRHACATCLLRLHGLMLERSPSPAYAPLEQLRVKQLLHRLGRRDLRFRRIVVYSPAPLPHIVRQVATLASAREDAVGDRPGPDRAVYTVGDGPHFLGVVGLVNSLRLTGWTEEIVVVDCGFAEWQRTLLAAEVQLLPAPPTAAPHFLKAMGPLQRPAQVMAVIDADVVITRPLDPLFRKAQDEQRLVAVADALSERFDERWGDLLGLGPLRPRTYVNSGFLITPMELGRRVFGELERLQHRIDVRRSMIASGTPEDPFYFLDQDALNALLASFMVSDDDLHVLPYETVPHPPFTGIAVEDAQALRLTCADGVQLYGLHHIQRKPWLHYMPSTPYSELLPRLWLADDLPLRLDRGAVPLRFRPGLAGAIASRCVAVDVRAARARRALGMRRRSPRAVGPT